MDVGHEKSSVYLKQVEHRIQQEYEQAASEVQKKLEDYLQRYEVKNRIKLDKLKKGEITKAEYDYWRTGQIMMGKRWEEMRDTLAQDLSHTNEIAANIVNGYLPEVYAINHNYGTYEAEVGALVDTSYTLYDRQTVERLARSSTAPIPKARVDIPKDLRWNQRQVTSAVMQSILQGEGIKKAAKRIAAVTAESNMHVATRNARTMITSAENAGRVDSYKRASGMGIKMEQVWLATLDGRTRHSHRQMDGVKIEVGGKFPNGCRYPGDPEGPAWEVYNCRCTLIGQVDGVDYNLSDVGSRNNYKLEGMTYEEWKNKHSTPLYVNPVSVPVNAINPVPTKHISAEMFVPALDAAKATCPDDKAWRVDTTRTAADFRNDNITTYITEHGSTFALKDDGDIISVCKNQLTDSETNARSLLAAAVEAGGTHLDSFDGNFGFYVRCGFEPVSRCKFSVEYAPPGWVPGRDAEEDIYFMRYVGVGNVKYNTVESARLGIPYSPGYGEAEEVVKRLVKEGGQ